jgi:hypothetical protein
LLTPLNSALAAVPQDLTTSILFLALSYILGVILSGFSELVLREWKIRRKGGLKELIRLPGFEAEVIRAFKSVFPVENVGKTGWSVTHYYVCRSLVFEYMPKAAQVIERQSSPRQLRMNMVPSILIWLCVGVAWGIWSIVNNVLMWGVVLIITSVALSLTIITTIVNRMNNNEEREVRETLTAFLAGHKAGAFKRENESDKRLL